MKSHASHQFSAFIVIHAHETVLVLWLLKITSALSMFAANTFLHLHANGPTPTDGLENSVERIHRHARYIRDSRRFLAQGKNDLISSGQTKTSKNPWGERVATCLVMFSQLFS